MSLFKKIANKVNPLIGPAVGVLGNYYSARRRERHDMKMSYMAHQQNIDFWKKQNEYNLPSMQMQRLKDAGLNPHLVYGTGTVDNTAGGIAGFVPPRSSEANFNPLEALSQYLGNESEKVSLKLKVAQIDTEQARRALTWAQQTATSYENVWKRLESLVAEEIMHTEEFRDGYRVTDETQIRRLSRSRIQELESRGFIAQLDQAIKELQAKLAEEGIMPGDNIWVRTIVNIAVQLGLNPSKIMNEIINQ